MLQILNPFKAGKEFQKLKSERKWLIALVIVFTAGLLTAAGKGIILQKNQDLKNQYLEETGALADENLGIHMIFLVVFVPVSWVIKSVVFHGVARGLGGEDVKISSTMYLIAFTHLPCIFKGLLDVFIGLMYQPPPYEEFVYQLQNPNVLWIFIKEYNIFFWAFTLMVIAVREQYNLSTMRAFLTVATLYSMVWIIQIAMLLSGSLFRVGI